MNTTNQNNEKQTNKKRWGYKIEARMKAWVEDRIALCCANTDLVFDSRIEKIEKEASRNKKTMFFMFFFLLGAILSLHFSK